MDAILFDRSTPSLAASVKANLYSYFRYFGQSSQAEFGVVPGLVRWHTRVPHPWFSGVISTRLPESGAGPLIEDTLAYFKSRQVDVFSWWLQPDLETAPWAAALQAEGFQYDDSTPGMVVDLTAAGANTPTPQGLRVIKVQDKNQLKLWAETFIRGYELPEAWSEIFYDLLASLGTSLPCRYYLGYLRNQPAAASTLFLGAGVAGIYNVATLPEARGRGIGSALTLAPMYDARQLGYRVGVLQASSMGYKLFKQLGFREMCRMEHFIWTREPHHA